MAAKSSKRYYIHPCDFKYCVISLNDKMSIKKLGNVIEDVYDDYEQHTTPFSEDLMITSSVTSKMETSREKALFLTLATSLNWGGRKAEPMYSKLGALWEENTWIFEPTTVIEDHEVDDIEDIFQREGTRYPHEDAKTWYEVSRTLYEEFDSNPITLFERFDYDVGQLDEYVKSARGNNKLFEFNKRFPRLRGEKIRPLWLRLINDQVHPLSAQEVSSIPVDTHIIQITNRICGVSLSNSARDKETIRRFWERVCNTTTVNPVEVDAPLWYLHRDWEDWGSRYFRRMMEKHDLSLGDVSFPFEQEETEDNAVQISQSKIEELAELAETDPEEIRNTLQDS